MNTSALPLADSSGVAIPRPVRHEKLIQRIPAAAGSNRSKARKMAEADDDLVVQSQNGSTSAFETLVRNYQQMIHALTFRMTGSSADAEDLAQEAFLRAYERIDSFNGDSKFSTWLYSIAVHACLNWRRDEARRFRAYTRCAEEARAQSARITGEINENERLQRTQAALLKLPPKQRAAIVLTIYDGLNHSEAAKVLRCSETTVSWRVFAAKRKLKRWLTPKGESLTRVLPLPPGTSQAGLEQHESDCAPRQFP
jgi:RNA polymerase sigma-70 factor (ECF subfamily)